MAKQENNPKRSRVTVCGIGASAGGIEALCEFFTALPTDLGMAYVVIVHLAPQYESELAQILARRTTMPVREVGDDQKLELEPNSVYVISPGRKLEIDDTSIGASRFDCSRETAERQSTSSFGRSPRTAAMALR